MVNVKVCGIRRDEDVRMMNILSSDYIGIVIGCPFSSRSVDFETAGKLFSEVRNGIGKVCVFVDMDEDEVIEFLLSGSADIAQLHGNESNQYIRKIQARTGKKVIKSFHPWEIDQAMKSAADIVLFDNMCPGSGALYDYSVLSGFPRPFIVAGGLSPDNVSEVISTLNPFAVDVSSSVESMGFKDYGKTSSFIKEARRVL